MPRTIFEIRSAKDSEETPEAAVQFISGMGSVLKTSFLDKLRNRQPTLTLEIASLNQRVFFLVTVDADHQELIKSQIAAQHPTAVITPVDDYLTPWSQHGTPAVGQLQLSSPYYFPLRTYGKFETTDPLSAVLGVLGKTKPDTAAVIQFVLTAAPNNWASSGRKVIQKGVSLDPEAFKAHPQQALIEEKLSTRAYHCAIRLFAAADTHSEAQNILSQIASAFGTYSLNDGNSLTLTSAKNPRQLIYSMINRSPHFLPAWQYLNTVELASLYHLPNKALSGLRNLAWGKTIKGEAPDDLPTEEEATRSSTPVSLFAKTEFKNQLTTFGIRLPDRRRHFYVLGKSGTGKSTLLANMAISDMENGLGLAVVDPHGDLVEQILLDYIPKHRIQDVVYLDPSDGEHVFHLNPLEVKRPEHKELAVSNILSIFTKIWANVWSARMEYILRNTLATLVEIEGSTMLDIPNILTDDKFRAQLLEKVDPATNRVILDFWNREYNAYNDRFRNEAIAPILNKVGQFISGATIRQILKNPHSTIHVEDLMNSGKIVLLNLSQGRIGEDNAALLGAMFITQFQLAAMNRINIPEEERRDFFLYVDEFQNFATESFIKILAEARKYRLDLVLANQYIAQLPEEIQKAIFGNVGTIATFVMGADDANHIMQEFGELYTQEDLVNLGRFQIITKLTIDDRISAPFPAYTLPPLQDKNQNRQLVLETSWSQHSAAPKLDAPYVPSEPTPKAGNKKPPKPDLSQVKIGEIYQGKVTNVKDYGAFVEILPGVQGLVHVSNMSQDFVKSATEVVKEGDIVQVRAYEIDDQDRLNLTMILEDKKKEKKAEKKPHSDSPLQPSS